MSASRCDRCGEVAADIDTGFSPAAHEMKHDCGGSWRVHRPCEPRLSPDVRVVELRDALQHVIELTYADAPDLDAIRSEALSALADDDALCGRMARDGVAP